LNTDIELKEDYKRNPVSSMILIKASQSLNGPTTNSKIFRIRHHRSMYWYNSFSIDMFQPCHCPMLQSRKRQNLISSIPVSFARTPVPFTWASLAFTGTSVPLARTPLSRGLTRHNGLICLAAKYIISHSVLWCLRRRTPLKVLLVLIRGKERLNWGHMR
jgi:hypothetical protein